MFAMFAYILQGFDSVFVAASADANFAPDQQKPLLSGTELLGLEASELRCLEPRLGDETLPGGKEILLSESRLSGLGGGELMCLEPRLCDNTLSGGKEILSL